MNIKRADINCWSMASMAFEFYMAEVILRCYYGNEDNHHFLSSPGMMFRDLYESFHVRERLPFHKVRASLCLLLRSSLFNSQKAQSEFSAV